MFRKSILVLAGFCFITGFASAQNPAVSFESVASVPFEAVLNQPSFNADHTSYGNTWQSYLLAAGSRVGFYQTITWNSDAPMTGFAFRVADIYGNPSFPAAVFDNSQNQVFGLQELNSGVVGSTIVQQVATAEVADVVGGQYLYARFASGVALTSGSTYVVHISPNALDSNNRIFVNASINPAANYYADGWSNSDGSGAPFASGVNLSGASGAGFDTTFFATAAVDLPVLSITPDTTGPVAYSDTVNFTVEFGGEAVNFADGTDIDINHSGTGGGVVTITGGPTVYNVAVTGVEGDGTYSIAVATDSDVAGRYGGVLNSSPVSNAVTVENVVAPLAYTNTTTAPATTVVLQPLTVNNGAEYGNATQARLTSPSDRKGVQQVFTWPTHNPIRFFGFRMAGVMGNPSFPLASHDTNQRYEFNLQLVNPDNSLGSMLFQKVGTLEVQDVVGGEFVEIEFDAPVALTSGTRYMAHLLPNNIDNNRLFVDVAASDPYAGGFGYQTPGVPYATDGSDSLVPGTQDHGFYAAEYIPLEITGITPDSGGPITADDTLNFTVEFNRSVLNFDDASDLLFNYSGSINTTITVTGSGATYNVALTGTDGIGSFTLAGNTASDIQDAEGFGLSASVVSPVIEVVNVGADPVYARSSALPSNVVTSQSLVANDGASYTDAIQTRYLSGANRRGAYQVFTWPSDNPIRKFAFRVAPVMGNAAYPLARHRLDQNYQYDLQVVNPDDSLGAILEQRSGVLELEDIVGGDFIEMEFASPVALTSGSRYLINFYPLSLAAENILFLDAFLGTDPYSGGFGTQNSGSSYATNGSASVTPSGNDLGFYAVEYIPLEITGITPDISGPVSSADTVNFTVEFNRDVVNFNEAADLVVSTTGSTTVSLSISGGPATYNVAVSNAQGIGSYSIAGNTASDIEDGEGFGLDASVSGPVIEVENSGIDPVFDRVTTIPLDVVISQPLLVNDGASYTSATQARYTTGADRRGVVQTFTWPGGDDITGFGFRVASVMGNPAFPLAAHGSDQAYRFDLQQINGDDTLGSLVYSTTGTLEVLDVNPADFIRVNFDEALGMESGARYIAYLLPLEIVAGNRLFIDTAGSNPYEDGFAYQNSGAPYATDGSVSLPAAGAIDLGFFATGSPPAAAAEQAVWMLLE